MTTTPNSTTSSTDLAASLELVEVKPGLKFSRGMLAQVLPDVETILFFGKVYELDYRQLSALLFKLLQSDLSEELFNGSHSEDLQDYLIDICQPVSAVDGGDVVYEPAMPHGEILPELWKSLEVEVAASIKAVAAKLQSVVGMLPGKQGEMVFRSMMKLNAKRPTLGDYRAQVHHAGAPDNLLIFDVSGSMTEHTVRALVDDVVSMSYMANAHLVIVSNTATWWQPGSYDTAVVLAKAEYGGTYYDELVEVLNQDWGTVITVADYDSSQSAKDFIAKNAVGSIETVLDISLVNRPTFLAECVGQLAQEVRPILVGTSRYVLS